MIERGIADAQANDEERLFEASLRPRSLADFTGQPKLKENLKIAIEAAKMRGEAMDHVLLYGPPGLGKTTIATLIANELGSSFEQTSAPVLQKKLDLTGLLSNIRAKQVFFIDEIHRLAPDVEEMLYSALEDFRVDILVGTGPGARTHSLPVPKFTAVGATTRLGNISAPLRGRFGLMLRLDVYQPDELAGIVRRSAKILDLKMDELASTEIARRSRGTPRIANRLLRRVRDYAQVKASGEMSKQIAIDALELLEVDPLGLDEVDRRIMDAILVKFDGGPVGLSTLSSAIDEEAGTIEDVYEPYLIQQGFVDRTPRGRIATDRAYEYFGLSRRRSASGPPNVLP
ncbi:Holliday junction branch migration DNA helicase RuvB [Bryobacter aggregatus]|uniref:Holliday junction branch migration DNA helicase RuvB n=1 Tax=Bryobacter aggregatus TaxID=360054 RepID=UPI0006895C98|nr:Holliday junction branch migration DNA helicase RuvB [Bryobacter aggregatus]